jgi:succinyl-diaminopimelate desuccinylase
MGLDDKKALQILQQLIRIRTPQPAGDELDAVKYIVSLLSSDSFENRVVHHGGNRGSLISEIRGAGSGGKMALVGNLDTVGLEDIALWKHSPFAADFEDGRVFGRGASNNKGGLTAILLTALALAEQGASPPKDVAFCFTADNDKGATGARALLDGGFFEGVDEILFAQPTDGSIGIGQKGLLWLDVDVSGRSAHVTKPDIGVNAFTAFIDFNKKIEELLASEREHPLLGVPLSSITALSAEGPTAYSIPDSASGRVDIRFPPNIDVDALHRKITKIASAMEAADRRLRINAEVANKRAAVGMTASSQIMKKLKRIYKKMGLPSKMIGLTYFTDASVIVPRLGVPFAFVGPGEDIYGKQGDESISLESVVKAAEIYLEFILE